MPFKGKPWRWAPLVLVLPAYLYFATAGRMSLTKLALEPKATEAYQLLTEGFLEGRLGMSLDPDPAFLALPDPYEPSAHQNPQVWDSSYYKGRYYMVHGPLPVLLFYLPVRLLTGRYPNGELTLLFFGSLDFLALYALLLRIKDQHFSGSGEIYALLGGLGIGTGNIVMANMVAENDYSFYFTCLASSAAVLAAGLYALYRAMEEDARPLPWLCLASLGIAAAALGRANMVLGDLVFLAGASAWALKRVREAPAWGRQKNRLLAAIWLPSLAVGAAMALYNYGRFGNPLEFGLSYQLDSLRPGTSGFLNPSRALEYIRFNWKVDFLQRFLVTDYFPFVRAMSKPVWTNGPKPYYGEDNIGFFSMWPAGWLLLLLPAAIGNWAGLEGAGGPRQPLAAFLRIMALMAAVQALLILSLASCTFRYFTDFAPSCMVLIPVTAWMLLDLPLRAHWKGLSRAFFEASTVFGLLVSVNFALCGSRGLFAARIPELVGFVNQLVHH